MVITGVIIVDITEVTIEVTLTVPGRDIGQVHETQMCIVARIALEFTPQIKGFHREEKTPPVRIKTFRTTCIPIAMVMSLNDKMMVVGSNRERGREIQRAKDQIRRQTKVK